MDNELLYKINKLYNLIFENIKYSVDINNLKPLFEKHIECDDIDDELIDDLISKIDEFNKEKKYFIIFSQYTIGKFINYLKYDNDKFLFNYLNEYYPIDILPENRYVLYIEYVKYIFNIFQSIIDNIYIICYKFVFVQIHNMRNENVSINFNCLDKTISVIDKYIYIFNKIVYKKYEQNEISSLIKYIIKSNETIFELLENCVSYINENEYNLINIDILQDMFKILNDMLDNNVILYDYYKVSIESFIFVVNKKIEDLNKIKITTNQGIIKSDINFTLPFYKNVNSDIHDQTSINIYHNLSYEYARYLYFVNQKNAYFNTGIEHYKDDVYIIYTREMKPFDFIPGNEIIIGNNSKCSNALTNEKLKIEDEFKYIWDNWDKEFFLKFSISNVFNFYKLNKSNYDMVKINIDYSVFNKLSIYMPDSKFYKHYTNVDLFEGCKRINNEYYIFCYSTNMLKMLVLGEDYKIFEVYNDSLSLNIPIKDKNYVIYNIENNGNIYFLDWYCAEGFKYKVLNTNGFSKTTKNFTVESHLLCKSKLCGTPKIYSERTGQCCLNFPYASLSGNLLNVKDDYYLGIGHMKVSNNNINYINVYGDSIYYYQFGKKYIRHFGSSYINTLIYNYGGDDIYINQDNNYYDMYKQYLKFDGEIDEDTTLESTITYCEGFKYYIYFYYIKLDKNINKITEFKISDSFIPYIPGLKPFSEHEFTLNFACSINKLDNNKIIITGGEGDCRSYMMIYDIDKIIESCIHDNISSSNANEVFDFEKYRFYPMVGKI